MVMEYFITLTETYTRESFYMTKLTEKAAITIKTVQNIKVNGLMTLKKVLEERNGKMVLFMKGTSYLV